MGIYIGQFCITTLTYFFITWFPMYLVQARHMSILKAGFAAALPALCGSSVVCWEEFVPMRCCVAARSLTFARKAPIMAGMLLSVTMIGLQLHQCAGVDDGADVDGVFRQGVWRAGLDGDRGHVAEGADRPERRACSTCSAISPGSRRRS